jgi:hypothetical protein
VQVIDMPSLSNVPQDDDKNRRQSNEDTHVSQDQMVTQVQDVDAPHPPLMWLIEEARHYFNLTHKISPSGVL